MFSQSTLRQLSETLVAESWAVPLTALYSDQGCMVKFIFSGIRYFLDNLFEKPECEKNCLLICLGLGHLGDTVGIKDQETPCVNENTFSPSECPLGVTTCGISLIFSPVIRSKNLRSKISSEASWTVPE